MSLNYWILWLELILKFGCVFEKGQGLFGNKLGTKNRQSLSINRLVKIFICVVNCLHIYFAFYHVKIKDQYMICSFISLVK